LYILDLDQLNPKENKLLNNIAKITRHSFNKLVENLSEDHYNNINWIVSSIASRNKYTSPLFLRCCQLVLIDNILNSSKKVDEIVLSDRPLADLLISHFNNSQRNISIVCRENIFQLCWRITRPFRQYFLAIIILLLRMIGRKPNQKYLNNDNKGLILLDTFVLNSTLGDGGTIYKEKYIDRYYSGIFDYLTKKEKKDIYYYPTIVGFKNPLSVFKQIRSCRDKFIIPDDFLKFSDYLEILKHPFKILKVKIPKTHFNGFDITSLLRQENIRNCSDHISLFGLLNYYFAYRFNDQKYNVRLLIDWYENQVLDRGMIVGFHQFHKNTKIIGYQGYVISPILHSYIYPNKAEIKQLAVPDKIAVIGKGLVDNVHLFSKDVDVITAPAFRNKKVWEERKSFPDLNYFQIFIALPISLKDSADILNKLVRVKEKIDLEIKNVRYVVKPHPTYTITKIKTLFSNDLPETILFNTGDFHRELEISNLLITNASTVALEALTKAIPVIIVGDQNGITQNPIPDSVTKIIWRICYTDERFINDIIDFYKKKDINQNVYNQLAKQIRTNYFEPINKDSVRNFLNFC